MAYRMHLTRIVSDSSRSDEFALHLYQLLCLAAEVGDPNIDQFMLVHCRRLKYVKVFGPLTAMVLSIVITASARLDKHGIKIVGQIPKGLPPVTVDR